jgi:hypothetical protein
MRAPLILLFVEQAMEKGEEVGATG